MSMHHALAYALCFLSAVTLLWYRKRASKLPLPPGPRKLPLVGNMFDLPSKFDWEVYAEWGKKYDSDILHVCVPGTSIVILNSLQAARDLFEKRSASYSSRAKFVLLNNFLGFSWLLPFMPYGTAWKERRRFFPRHVHPQHSKTPETEKQETEYARNLLLQLLESPEDYLKHIQHAVGGTLYTAAYGLKVKRFNDPYLNVAAQVMQVISDVTIPISALADSAPWILPILAPFLPGPAFQKSRAEWQEIRYRFRDEPFFKAQKLMQDGFVSRCLESIDLSQDEEAQHNRIKDAASTFFIGGSATTTALMHTFVLIMLAFPEVQSKAQSELDRVVGRSRLPKLADEVHLPYMAALLKEVHRWKTVGPIGVPHFLDVDDEYRGYLIPGQSLIIGNAWAMLHDEKEYPQPSVFRPERFLKDGELDMSVRDPATIVFGFGRRVCPGAHIARSLFWIQAASVLSAFKISKAVDEQGNIVEPSMKFHNGVTLQPEPFKCTFTPRHDKVDALIRACISDTD